MNRKRPQHLLHSQLWQFLLSYLERILLSEHRTGVMHQDKKSWKQTLTPTEFFKQSSYQRSDAASNMHWRTFFSNGQSRCNSQGLRKVVKEMARHEQILNKHTRVKLLIKNVAKPRKPCMTNPARMHLISEMPDPAAYFAKERTRWDAMNENMACHGWWLEKVLSIYNQFPGSLL